MLKLPASRLSSSFPLASIRSERSPVAVTFSVDSGECVVDLGEWSRDLEGDIRRVGEREHPEVRPADRPVGEERVAPARHLPDPVVDRNRDRLVVPRREDLAVGPDELRVDEDTSEVPPEEDP